ncbi:MAG: cofactor-independent phosphoglycerate mutase [Clostridia bacterium]|nr:cofactor-independent phosphoglycerate mutase [Clostridia bacterium]
MKYVIILCDGMSDYNIPELNGRTPLEAAFTPNMDALAAYSELGLAQSVPVGMKPGSDTANLSILGYDPALYYSGRSPLEALAMGITLKDTDIAIRCNLVTLSDDDIYDNKIMLDYSAGEITTPEAHQLIKHIEANFGSLRMHFHAGISYRHCLVMENAALGTVFTPPHDITGKQITAYMPSGLYGEEIAEMQRRSYALLDNHPINIARRKAKLRPANSIWLWGEGVKPKLKDFYEKNGIKGAMISAVDLLKGIAFGANMTVVEVEGANGTLHTNYLGKAQAALNVLEQVDFVYIHIEAPDEMGHQGELNNKIKAIENIDRDIVKTVVEGLRAKQEEFSILICPDHATPIAIRTHSSDPIPYMLYRSNNPKNNNTKYNEKVCAESGLFVNQGSKLIEKLLERGNI